jgi:hypothetical protein
MQVVITNATSGDFYVSMLNKSLTAGESVTVTGTSQSALDGESQLKKDVQAGNLTLAFTVETEDAVITGQGSTLPAYANAAGLPAANSYPFGTHVWQTDAALAVWTDGTNWRTAAGVITS